MFLISGQNIRIAGDTLCRLLSVFRSSAPDIAPVCTITEVSGTSQFDVRYLNPVHPVAHVFGVENRGGGLVVADADYENITAAVVDRPDTFAPDVLLPAIISRLAFYRSVFVHAALIDTKDHGGLLFVGPSGVGKTTQAELWAKYRGADILNGDKVFLSLNEAGDKVTAHGNPWRGSSPWAVNRSVPLTAIVVLEQATENTVRRLDDMEALAEYATHIFLPTWDGRCTDAVMETVGNMLPLVPVYKLACRPDAASVALTRRTLYGETD